MQLTLPCSDDGKRFIQTERLDVIKQALRESKYECRADRSLAKVYSHRDFRADKPNILVSCHIDSLYGEYYAHSKRGVLQGTFDNSVCNAIVVEAMVQALLPSQVLISFTGDEENDSKGVDQTIESLKQEDVFDNINMVISLDLTEEHYRSCSFTVENDFVKKELGRSLLRFGRKRDIKEYLRTMIDSPVFVKDADADESWQYDEYDLNSFSLCLPCRLLGTDMHDDIGVAIKEGSVVKYLEALEALTQSINEDLTDKADHRLNQTGKGFGNQGQDEEGTEIP